MKGAPVFAKSHLVQICLFVSKAFPAKYEPGLKVPTLGQLLGSANEDVVLRSEAEVFNQASISATYTLLKFLAKLELDFVCGVL